jgi:zinc transporter ZupT
MIILYIILGAALFFGIGAYVFSNSGSPKERAAEAAGAAAGGAMMAGSCLFQILVMGIVALAGIWLLTKIF